MVVEGEMQRAHELDVMEKVAKKMANLKLAAYFLTLHQALELERCLLNAVQHITNRELSRAMAAWQSRTFDEQEHVSKFESAFRKLRNIQTSKAFGQWGEFASARAYSMSCLEKSMGEMRMTVYGWVVPRWVDYVDYVHKVRRATMKLRDISICRAWNTWLEENERRKDERQERLRVFGALANVKVAAAWRTCLGAGRRRRRRVAARMVLKSRLVAGHFFVSCTDNSSRATCPPRLL